VAAAARLSARLIAQEATLNVKYRDGRKKFVEDHEAVARGHMAAVSRGFSGGSMY
jgi:hypothetical protein